MVDTHAVFTGTLVNVATVLLGTAVGALVGRRIPERLQQTILAALGLLTAAIAIRETLSSDRFVLVLAAVLLGAVIGELLRIEQSLERLGLYLQARLASGSTPIDVEVPEVEVVAAAGAASMQADGQDAGTAGADNRFAQGFIISSLVFCIGPLTILGSINDGLGDPELLLIKAGLDGFASIAFAAVYGWGVALSAGVVLIVQGGIALLAGSLEGTLTDPMIDALASTGGVLLLGIALRLLDLKHIRVANLLPALLIAPVLVRLFP
jgi:uncharacterized membrane protein YqgA involved in biofilm formation